MSLLPRDKDTQSPGIQRRHSTRHTKCEPLPWFHRNSHRIPLGSSHLLVGCGIGALEGEPHTLSVIWLRMFPSVGHVCQCACLCLRCFPETVSWAVAAAESLLTAALDSGTHGGGKVCTLTVDELMSPCHESSLHSQTCVETLRCRSRTQKESGEPCVKFSQTPPLSNEGQSQSRRDRSLCSPHTADSDLKPHNNPGHFGDVCRGAGFSLLLKSTVGLPSSGGKS